MWIDKHQPKSLDEFHCYSNEISQMKRWIKGLKYPDEKSTNSLFISGPPGIGKTTLSRLLLQEYNYYVIELNASDIRSQKSVQSVFKKALQSFDVLQLQNNQRKMIGIIMDEVDGMSSGDRGGLAELAGIVRQFKEIISGWIRDKNKAIETKFSRSQLQQGSVNYGETFLEISCPMEEKKEEKAKRGRRRKKVEGSGESEKIAKKEEAQESETTKGKKKRKKKVTLKYPCLQISPIICISNITVDKKLNDLKKNSLEINLDKPKKNSLEKTCLAIMDRENMSLTCKAIEILLEYGQSDFRKILMIMEELHRNFGDKEIDDKTISHFLSNNLKKQIDLTIFEATKLLYQKYPTDRDMIYYYETDRSLISMMIHENIYQQMNIRKTNQSEKVESLIKIMHHFSLGDIIDKYIYNFQCWNLQDLNGYIKCSIPSFYLNQFPTKKKNYEEPLHFTNVLSRQAVQLNNMKVSIQVKNKCKFQRRYVGQIGSLLTQRLRFPEIIEEEDRDVPSLGFYQMANRYQIDLSNMEKLIKLQVWDLSPVHLTKKNRNHLRQNLKGVDEI